MMDRQGRLEDNLALIQIAHPALSVIWSRAGSSTAILHVACDSENAPLLEASCRTLIQGNGWLGLAIIAGPDAADTLPAAIMEMTKAGLFADCPRIAVIAQGAAADLAARISAVLPGAHAVVFLDDADTLPTQSPGQGWLVADPFGRLPATDLPEGWQTLAAPGMGPAIPSFLRRTNLSVPVLKALVDHAENAAPYGRLIRARRLARPWRMRMEQHLLARGRDRQVAGLVRSFRQNVQNHRPVPPRPAVPMPQAPRLPRSLGNIWHLQDRGDSLIYLSDQYDGQVLGFEERDGMTLGQTGPVAIAMISVGGAATVRPQPESFAYHLTDENLNPQPAARGAQSHAAHSLRLSRQRRRAFHTTITLSEPCSGMRAEDAAMTSALMQRLCARVAQARIQLQSWDKALFVDRIIVDLLAGEIAGSRDDLSALYPCLIADLRDAVARAAGQNSLPLVVLSQSAGLRDDGRQCLILTEGQLEQRSPAAGIVVATPVYPFRLMPNTVATLDPKERLLVDEIEALAITALHDGKEWYCPIMRQVIQTDNRLLVDFASMAPLVLEDAPHGFRLEGCTNEVRILEAEARGTRVVLTLDQVPHGQDMRLCYAWGHQREISEDDRFANHGALRDSWSMPSIMQMDRTLHRFALAARLPVMPSDLD